MPFPPEHSLESIFPRTLWWFLRRATYPTYAHPLRCAGCALHYTLTAIKNTLVSALASPFMLHIADHANQ